MEATQFQSSSKCNSEVTLQVSLAPSDYKHAIHMLEHQLSVFEDQVAEILLTYDTHKSKGRFAIGWEENNSKLWTFLETVAKKHQKVRLLKIDYSKTKKKEIANRFLKLKTIPAKDWRGGPFYTYFFGINESKHDFVFHIDSDMFFGGLSKTWMTEAIKLYDNDESILFVSPLAGPPRLDGKLINQATTLYKEKAFHFRFSTMSTRLFLVNRTRLLKYSLGNIRTFKINELLRALYRQNPAYRLPEDILSSLLVKNDLIRVDFKGESPDLWSLHPPYRTDEFYKTLPMIIDKIVKNNVPYSQLGYYDIVDELVDWSKARDRLK
nr:hypothetical protein [uncultured Pedobacter sp.]